MTSLRLTFDDGPSEWTYPLLDLLNEHKAKATFFVVGQRILDHENLLRRMVAHGHTVGNHTLTHPKLSSLDVVAQRVELEACSYLVERACGVRPAVWRAPYFDRPEEAAAQAAALGMEHMDADVDPHDWEFHVPRLIAERAAARGPDAVVCLHDGIPPDGGNGTDSRAPTVEAVRLLLEGKA